MRRRCTIVLAGLLCCVGSANAALTFNFTKHPDTTQEDYDTILPAITQAAQLWSDVLADDITINLTIGYAELPQNVLGQASVTTGDYTYSEVRSALIADAKTPNDAIAVSHLPAGSSLTFFTNNRAGTRILDDDNSANNTHLDLPTANAKALGLSVGNPNASDGTLIFSNVFPWDLDRSDGIDMGLHDFVATAAHEIAHVTGFSSGVDIVDAFSGSGPNAGVDLNDDQPGIGELDPFRVFTVLDLYRRSSDALEEGADVLDLATGGSPYFSIDGGQTSLVQMSTGAFNGSGWQASHWTFSFGLGLMVPAFFPGQEFSLTDLDLTAMDVIGYDPVPEPGALAVVSGAMVLLLRRRRQMN